MDWRSIDKAPKDGTEILLAATLDGGQDVCVLGRWVLKEWVTVAADGAGPFAVASRGWLPTHFHRWTTPRTVAEVEAAAHAETAQRVTAEEYRQLCRRIIGCCYWYYVKNRPATSDEHFDRMHHRLQEIERSGVVEVDPASPGGMIYGDQESQYPEWAKDEVRL